MKKILFVLLLCFGFFNFVGAINLSNSTLEIGKELSIYGKGFGGSIGQYGGICFGDDNSCFVQGSDGIVFWSDGLIRVFVPGNIKLKGDIKLYVSGKLFGTTSYFIKPSIVDISDGTYVKKSGGEGERVLIQGNGFGNVIGSVYFGEYKASIISWSENRIWINLPKVQKVINNFRVENSVGMVSDRYYFDMYPKISNDQYSDRQSYLSVLGVQDVWNKYKFLGDGITVAVLDVGVKLNHPDLRDNLRINQGETQKNGIDDDKNGYVDDVYGWNFVDNNNNMEIKSDHGTMVAGIIAAKKDNGIGIAGIAPNSKIMTLKIFDDSLKLVYNLENAVRYAVDNGAKIINLSFGTDDNALYQTNFDRAFSYAYDKGAVIIAAAGNSLDLNKQDLDKYPSSPVCNDANRNLVIGVASINNQKIKSDFSSYGANCIDISTMGENIFSLSDRRFNSGNIDYYWGNGTSFAAPIVAGAVALFWSNNPHLKNTDIYQALKQTGDDIDYLNPDYKGKLGKSLNIKKLMERGDGEIKEQANVDKKAFSVFLSLRVQMRDYSVVRRHQTYKSIYDMLDRFSKDPNQEKNLVFINGLMYLIGQEISK